MGESPGRLRRPPFRLRVPWSRRRALPRSAVSPPRAPDFSGGGVCPPPPAFSVAVSGACTGLAVFVFFPRPRRRRGRLRPLPLERLSSPVPEVSGAPDDPVALEAAAAAGSDAGASVRGSGPPAVFRVSFWRARPCERRRRRPRRRRPGCFSACCRSLSLISHDRNPPDTRVVLRPATARIPTMPGVSPGPAGALRRRRSGVSVRRVDSTG